MNEDLNSYIAIDLETSGLQPKTDKIIEIGAWKVIDGVLTDSFETLVNPHLVLSESVQALTGITMEMLAGAPEIDAVIGPVIDFCGAMPLLGHHVIFDYSFLKKAAVNKRLEFEKDGIDTLKLCRRIMPETEQKNLAAACRYFQIRRTDAHRALADARDAHRLYQCLRIRHQESQSEWLKTERLIYKAKREQPASKKQKEDLRELIKYHRIEIPVEINHLSRNEISRITDKIILQYGRIRKRKT